MQDVQRAREPAHAGQVQVAKQGRGARQPPCCQRRTAEVRRQPAAHPALAGVAMAAQDERRAQRGSQAEQFQPDQPGQVQLEGERGRGDEGGEDVQQHGRDNQPPELGRAAARGAIALLLEAEDHAGRVERIFARARRAPVSCSSLRSPCPCPPIPAPPIPPRPCLTTMSGKTCSTTSTSSASSRLSDRNC